MKKRWIPLTGIFALTLSLSGCFLFNNNQGDKSEQQGQQGDTSQEDLQIDDVKTGTGKEAVSGKRLTVHYTGRLTDGTKFDSSKDRNQPFVFELGAGKVIQGWEQGFKGMKEGGSRKLTIPPQLGYGARAVGPIPANSTLIFDVELLKVE